MSLHLNLATTFILKLRSCAFTFDPLPCDQEGQGDWLASSAAVAQSLNTIRNSSGRLALSYSMACWKLVRRAIFRSLWSCSNLATWSARTCLPCHQKPGSKNVPLFSALLARKREQGHSHLLARVAFRCRDMPGSEVCRV